MPLYGLNEIDVLGTKYGSIVDGETLAIEYASYKIYVTSNYPRAEIGDLLSLFSSTTSHARRTRAS